MAPKTLRGVFRDLPDIFDLAFGDRDVSNSPSSRGIFSILKFGSLDNDSTLQEAMPRFSEVGPKETSQEAAPGFSGGASKEKPQLRVNNATLIENLDYKKKNLGFIRQRVDSCRQQIINMQAKYTKAEEKEDILRLRMALIEIDYYEGVAYNQTTKIKSLTNQLVRKRDQAEEIERKLREKLQTDIEKKNERIIDLFMQLQDKDNRHAAERRTWSREMRDEGKENECSQENLQTWIKKAKDTIADLNQQLHDKDNRNATERRLWNDKRNEYEEEKRCLEEERGCLVVDNRHLQDEIERKDDRINDLIKEINDRHNTYKAHHREWEKWAEMMRKRARKKKNIVLPW